MINERAVTTQAAARKPAVVKKYANRRLYNTATSSYVTLEELAQMVRAGQEFVVTDATKTGEDKDITRSVLTQIILEEDSKGRNLLPISFLRQLISFYDDSLRVFLPNYLELSMESFARHQNQMRSYVQEAFPFFPYGQFEDLVRQNQTILQRAMSSLFPPLNADGERLTEETGTEVARTPPSNLTGQMQELRAKLDEVHRQLEELKQTSRSRPVDEPAQ